MNLKQQLLAAYQQLLLLYQKLQSTSQSSSVVSNSQLIYNEAAACLDKHITLDSTVPPDLGCAESVSYVLTNAGIIGIPVSGFPGTAGLYDWLLQSPQFKLTSAPGPGDIVISPTGTSSINSPHGHTGINANYGILSNDSDTGLFTERYTLDSWDKYFQDIEGFPIYYFHAI